MKNKEQIKIVLEDFDFKKVHRAMTHEGLKWRFENGIRVPTLQELEHNAKLYLEKVASSKEEIAIFKLGGFCASKEGGILQLQFILEESNPLGSLFNSKK